MFGIGKLKSRVEKLERTQERDDIKIIFESYFKDYPNIKYITHDYEDGIYYDLRYTSNEPCNCGPEESCSNCSYHYVIFNKKYHDFIEAMGIFKAGLYYGETLSNKKLDVEQGKKKSVKK